VKQGAKGMKLHPIIQRAPLNGKKTFEAVEAFSVHGLPILFHCGVSSYYPDPEKPDKENASFGEIFYAKELVAAFPNVPFIAGHAGLFKYKDVIDLLSPFKNVMVDTSVQSPAHVRELIRAFGPERVMYASDWPYGNRIPAIKIIKKACRGDSGLEKRIFYENAAALLKI
jgi:predicted TIM-barrel fold metal-dependent hydrolase